MYRDKLKERQAQLNRRLDELEARIFETDDVNTLDALAEEMNKASDILAEINLILADYEADGRAIII